MPARQGDDLSSKMGSTTTRQKTEIQENIIEQIDDPTKLMRTKNDLFSSDNFHLDAKEIKGKYKVEIQFKKGTKQTVSVIMLDDDSTIGAADVQTGLSNSLADQHIWLVTSA